MKAVLRFLYKTVNLLAKAFYKFVAMPIKKSMFDVCGKRVSIRKGSSFTYKNIYVGNNVFIGRNANFLSAKAKIIIGDDVMFGGGVSIITGEHRTDIKGRPMISITDDEKLPENDQDVILEGDIGYVRMPVY